MQELFKIFLPLFWSGLTFGLRHNGGLGIYGGFNISIDNVPYMALYRPYNVSTFCGATIIHEQYVLTTLHCVPNNIRMRVTVGTDNTDLGTDYEQEEAIFLDQNIDVALIKLKTKMELSKTVQIIKMADKDVQVGQEMLSLGFGKTESDDFPKQLKGVFLPYFDQMKCVEIYKKFNQDISDTDLCAGGVEGEGDCYGDAGSPLVYNMFDDRVYGLASRNNGKGCALKGVPTVFVRISAIKDKIVKIINGD